MAGEGLGPGVRTAGDPMPARCEIIQVYVGELRQLFNAMDPSPFREKDLDPNAEEFIVGWAKDAPAGVPLGLQLHLDRSADAQQEFGFVKEAVGEFFGHRAEASRRTLRLLLRRGRTSLAIGLLFLAASILAGEFIAGAVAGSRVADIMRESFLIGGWVAMWRPLEVFLYEWWPIRAEARLFDRLSAMPVRLTSRAAAEGTPANPLAPDRPSASTTGRGQQ
jgi:hypothetical protein